jgi:4'-phosphopantetheinyl transferase EntD
VPLASILPPGAVSVEMRETTTRLDPASVLLAEELVAIDGAIDARRREFAGGRACARRALELLGAAPVALPAGDDGAPLWPDGIVGSITHKRDYRAAAVAPAEKLAALGIDAECNESLPRRVLERVASHTEIQTVEEAGSREPGVAWDRLLFSAKEAAFKATRQLVREPIELRTSQIHLDPANRTLDARLPRIPPLAGRWTLDDGMLLVAIGLGQPFQTHRL